MATLLHPTTYYHLLRCPCSGRTPLSCSEDRLYCHECHREFNVSDGGILELVEPDALDAETARELTGNTYKFTLEQAMSLALADRSNIWHSYYSRSRKGTILHLSKLLDRLDTDQVFFLGSGTGREIEYLLQCRKLRTVFCSDLSVSTLRLVPYRLHRYDLKLGLFTSDLNHCPIRRSAIPIMIVNALHHTQDMHVALEKILLVGHQNILFVEPTDNFLVHCLEKRGLARRVEYSGVKPGRLDLRKLQALGRRHGYKLRVTTHWIFPEDYFRKVFGKFKCLQNAFLAFLDLVSILTNLVKFGNVSIVHMEKLPG